MMIQVSNLSKSFNHRSVLKGVSFNVSHGEVISLLGSSGSGKTTLLRCLNALEHIQEGDVLLNGKSLKNLPPQNVALDLKIGMIFQNFHLFQNKTVWENLIYAPSRQGKNVEKKALDLLKRFNIDSFKNAYPDSLSGGQKQRVAILRALLLDPQILLFDEPTSALDPENVYDVVGLIQELSKMGMTMIIVSHELSFIKNVSKRILFLDEGSLIEDSSVKDFFKSPNTQRAKDFLKHFLY